MNIRMTAANITTDEWMDVWNSTTILQEKVLSLESKISELEERIKELEQPATIYGKEVQYRE